MSAEKPDAGAEIGSGVPTLDPGRLVQALVEAGWPRVGNGRGHVRFQFPRSPRRSLVVPTDRSAPEFDSMLSAALAELVACSEEGVSALRVLTAATRWELQVMPGTDPGYTSRVPLTSAGPSLEGWVGTRLNKGPFDGAVITYPPDHPPPTACRKTEGTWHHYVPTLPGVYVYQGECDSADCQDGRWCYHVWWSDGSHRCAEMGEHLAHRCCCGALESDSRTGDKQ
jgi:hypothetical protein